MSEVITPPPESTPVEASNRLSTLTGDKLWVEKLLTKDPATTKEFRDLTELSSKRDSVEIAMANGGTQDYSASGVIPDSDTRIMSETAGMLRGLGIREEVIKSSLAKQEVTQQDYDLAAAWKTQHMKDADFVKKYLAGDVESVRQMMLANILVSSPIKPKAA
jgi:hypothetical protein